uniref:Mitochondrial thiamine pyrophosphate carrier n=1 Tax=Panagrolaimus sp. JU765 TaxID=591449 RepID=A0AC34QE50_9BILA
MVGFNPEPINGRELSSFEYSEAGLISGIATRAIIQPLDVLKIRFQLQEEPMRGIKTGKYTGLFQSIRVIMLEEGYQAFWKGHIPAQGLSAVYGLVQFSSFEIISKDLAKFEYFRHNKKVLDFFAGAIAGCTAMTAAMPLDVIRTRLVAQGEPKVYRSTIHAAKKIWRHEKIPGFFRGITPSLAQIAPFTGLQFFLYNYIHKLWSQYTTYDTTGALFSGAAAGTISKMILYPLDLIRHRLQVNAFVRRGFGSTTRHKSMVKAIIGIAKKESLFGLFKGLGPSLIKAAANSGCSFLFYEIACDILRKA